MRIFAYLIFWLIILRINASLLSLHSATYLRISDMNRRTLPSIFLHILPKNVLVNLTTIRMNRSQISMRRAWYERTYKKVGVHLTGCTIAHIWIAYCTGMPNTNHIQLKCDVPDTDLFKFDTFLASQSRISPFKNIFYTIGFHIGRFLNWACTIKHIRNYAAKKLSMAWLSVSIVIV